MNTSANCDVVGTCRTLASPRGESNSIANKVEVDFDMLLALVLKRIGGEVGGADIITLDNDGARWRAMEFLK